MIWDKVLILEWLPAEASGWICQWDPGSKHGMLVRKTFLDCVEIVFGFRSFLGVVEFRVQFEDHKMNTSAGREVRAQNNCTQKSENSNVHIDY